MTCLTLMLVVVVVSVVMMALDVFIKLVPLWFKTYIDPALGSCFTYVVLFVTCGGLMLLVVWVG